ncbi:MAG: hypothetical protein WAV90_25150 [Gordonia amarae]
MSDKPPKLHVTQHAILTESNGVWTGRYGGEDWSVTAGSKEEALKLMVQKLEQVSDDYDRDERLVDLAERIIAGTHTEEGFEAEYISDTYYEDRMIEIMEAQFDDD